GRWLTGYRFERVLVHGRYAPYPRCMEFPLAASLAPHLLVLDEVASTNDELTARATAEALPEFTVVATTTQTAGRGRLGRSWQAPPGTSLAASLLVHPQNVHLGSDLYGWLPLV